MIVASLILTELAQAANPFLPESVTDRGWPHLRGSNLDGRSSEIHLADSWPEAGPPVLWNRSLGQGYSGFVAFGNRVYTQYQTIAGQFVVGLDADTGRTIWEHRYDWPFDPAGVYPGPRGTPTYYDGRIYFCSPDWLLGCLHADDGRLLWSLNLKERFRGRGSEFGYSISPTVEAGRVLLPVGGKGAGVVALDAADGSVVWQSGDLPASYTPAYPIAVGRHLQVIAYMENSLEAYDFATGRQLWSRHLSQGYDEHSAWPLYSDPHLWISGPFRGGSQLFELTGGNDAEWMQVRTSPVMSNDIFSSVLIDGHIYGFDLKDVQSKVHRPSRGTFRCLDFLTGKQLWETDATGHCTVIAADGKLILFNDLGELILARASPEKYEELARVAVLSGEICWTQPILHRGRLYVRNQSQAACIYLGEPELLQTGDDAPLKTVAELSQSTFRDWTGLLGIEPEYAFDIPSDQHFRDWFLYSWLGVLGSSACLAIFAKLLLRTRLDVIGCWRLFWGFAFVLGAVATTPLSLWREDFTFTWPVCVFVAFQGMVFQSRWSAMKLVAQPRLQSYAAALVFLMVAAAYYLICRRLSLVFEWAFLFGFPFAVPFLLPGAHAAQRERIRILSAVVWTSLGFAAYYWCSYALLATKY